MNNHSEEAVVCCSAPGKVLVTGGYLVLERPNPGLVLTVNARFYSTIQPLPPSSSSSLSPSLAKIVVVSPQFKSTLEYSLQWEPVLCLKPLQVGQRDNKYVEKTVLVSVECIKALLPKEEFSSRIANGLLIHIVGDNQFYSLSHQLKRLQLPPTAAALQSLPPFLETGLGSSAALVASLTGALMSFFKVADFDKGWRTEVAHNAAQLAHSAAQGKIGSGFDISSAVFGSQVYSRFAPEPIMPLLAQLEEGNLPDVSLLLSEWDNGKKPFSLPAGMTLQLGDVGVGSNTPILVRKVLEWRSSGLQAANDIWNNLNEANKRVEEHFAALHAWEKSDSEDYKSNLAICAELPADQWETQSKVGAYLHDLRHVFSNGVRQGMRTMGSQAGVQLEPPSQTLLADATMEVKGCLIAGVPGAGGYDAMFAIVLSAAAGARVEQLWSSWTPSSSPSPSSSSSSSPSSSPSSPLASGSVFPLILHEGPLGLCQGPLPAGLTLSTA